MLDVHPPHHPTHTWTDFFIHIATIVVGLLIAVGLEQTVEYFHHHHQLEKARSEIREELERNQAVAVEQLQRLHELRAELDADQALVLEQRATGTAIKTELKFDWAFRGYRWAAWEVNKQSGALDLMPHRELVFDGYDFDVAHLVMESAAAWEIQVGTAKAIAQRSSPGRPLTQQDCNELLTAIAAAKGAISRTETLVGFERDAVGQTLSTSAK